MYFQVIINIQYHKQSKKDPICSMVLTYLLTSKPHVYDPVLQVNILYMEHSFPCVSTPGESDQVQSRWPAAAINS